MQIIHISSACRENKREGLTKKFYSCRKRPTGCNQIIHHNHTIAGLDGSNMHLQAIRPILECISLGNHLTFIVYRAKLAHFGNYFLSMVTTFDEATLNE